MLLAGQSISPDVRQALRENRLEDAAQLLMRQYGLTRAETGDLLGVDLGSTSIRSKTSNPSKRYER
jgi:FAD synthase